MLSEKRQRTLAASQALTSCASSTSQPQPLWLMVWTKHRTKPFSCTTWAVERLTSLSWRFTKWTANRKLRSKPPQETTNLEAMILMKRSSLGWWLNSRKKRALTSQKTTKPCHDSKKLLRKPRLNCLGPNKRRSTSRSSPWLTVNRSTWTSLFLGLNSRTSSPN